MKKFLIVGSSLAAVAAAGSAGAVDVTLGGSINMGVEFGLGKNKANLVVGDAFNEVSLSIDAAHTTDGGLSFGGAFTMGTAAEIKFNPYEPVSALGAKTGNHYAMKATVEGRTDIEANLWNVSGGGAIKEADVVSVKINSAWIGIDTTMTTYDLLLPTFKSSNICKIAGRGNAADGLLLSSVNDTNGNAAVAGAYLAAGQAFNGVMNSTQGASANVTVAGKGVVTFADGAGGNNTVTSAAVYAGPFMEVMMASSETKMVVGVACLEGTDETDTSFYMDNASKVMTVSNASIYIDGGFGRLTLQSSDYAGGVTAIAGAGDRANIKDPNGLVVIAQGLGILGANPYIAMDLAKGDSLGGLEIITGGTINLGGLSAAVDVALDNDKSSTATDDDLFGVSTWDLGATYAMGDLSLAFATDSSTDWGLSAAMAIAGFNVSTTFGSSGADDHVKEGITYSVAASTALNGFGLSLGFDQDLQPTVGVSYDLGGLVLSAGYDAGEEGGSIGAKLSF
jgi:hypothetical protein